MRVKEQSMWVVSVVIVLMAMGIMPRIASGDDTAAPELAAFSFAPETVDTSAGPASIVFTFRVIDDLSGFDWAQLHMASPSMGQELYMWWFGDGELDGTFEWIEELPQYSEAGAWSVSNLALMDKAGNRRDIPTQELGDLGFPTTIHVMPSPDDIVPPELLEFDFAPTAVDTSAGRAPITFTVRISDDRSGLDWAQLHMTSPSMGQELYAWWFGDGELDYVAQPIEELPQYSETGTWSVNNLALVDKAGNRRDIATQELSDLGFPTTIDVLPSLDDVTAPELLEFDFVPKSVDTSAGRAPITFVLRVIDDLSGLDWAQLHLKSPSMGQELYAWWFADGELDYAFERIEELPQYSETGTWFVNNLALMDKAGNRRNISTDELSELTFPVTVEVTENEAATAVAKVLEAPPIVVGDTVHLDGCGSTDPEGEILAYAWSFHATPDGSSVVIADPGAAATSFVVDQAGVYVIQLIVSDGAQDSEPDRVTVTAVPPEAAAAETLEDALVAIGGIAPESFRNTTLGKPLERKVNAALTMVRNRRYEEALDKLQDDILPKTDGCAVRGQPDKDDWIIDCDAQAALYPLIKRTVELVKRLVT